MYRGVLLPLVLFATTVYAQPNPGDVYREYTYTNTYGDAGGSIRVGGKKGVSYPDRGSDFDYVNAWIQFPHELDFEEAVRAEVVVEKILSHNGTTGLAIQWNDDDWLPLPVPNKIPQPQADYYHHTCITQRVPLDSLRPKENRFRLKVSPQQTWNWPQHLIYGVHLRVYYDAEKKEHARGRVALPQGKSLPRNVELKVDLESTNRLIERVDFLGKYEGVNWAGDGEFNRWQYFYYHGKLMHHIGTTVTRPFKLTWDTSWIPDQPTPIQIAARIIDDTGLISMTAAEKGLELDRPGLSVELCKPEDVPDNWVTRNDAYEQKLTVKGATHSIRAARLCWSIWRPGYMNGLFVNGEKILHAEGPKYRYFAHVVPLKDLTLLKSGVNTISTGKTPLYDGKMVHGMEVNWPGIQLLIQRKNPQPLSRRTQK